MKKKTKAAEKEQVEVDIVESKESCIVGHFTDRFYARGTSIDFTTYMFRIKVQGDDDNEETGPNSPNTYSCVIYLDPQQVSDLSFKLKSAMQLYEKKYGSIMEKQQ